MKKIKDLDSFDYFIIFNIVGLIVFPIVSFIMITFDEIAPFQYFVGCVILTCWIGMIICWILILVILLLPEKDNKNVTEVE